MEIQISKIQKEQAWELRHEVMWPNEDFNYIKLKDDASGIHLGLFKDNILISIVTLFIDKEEAQFRKFATLISEQGKGYGSRLLESVFEEAKKHDVKRIWCNARKNKSHFYRKFGLQETDRSFMKNGEAYVIMEKFL
ncbi:putative N-acetyltransferase YitI [Oceanobacillus oncorhynchi subsp. incaldanensis]|uniref:Acetyltransferase (GNAT) family protein n=1 Tax=Oceanobacillus oncorhynchi TaxID=545501 RepID=A0A0A1MXW3_9BACI|nr:putative N-acetyltransferase YitI [Oceanobacillus oncorhynchi subsp. incaldanensis]CEI83636.1 Acetyltransferase (GNAT) family protein [Oceanobacillus oncorhynchi]